MKKSVFLIVFAILSLFASLSFAQAPEVLWTKTLSGNVGYSVYPMEDGGFVVGGYTTVDGYRDFYICKTDGAGDLLWEHTFGLSDRSETMNAMIRTSDGGFLLCGNRPEDSPYSSDTDAYLVKTDADGNLEWASVVGSDNESENPLSVAESSEGGFVMCGSYWYDGYNGYDVMMLKVNELGAFEWKEYFNLDESSADFGAWVEVNADGSFLVAGKTQAFTTNWDDDAFVIMTTPLGTLESVSTFGENWPMYEGANRLLQCSDGAWLVVGYQNDDGLDNNWYVVKTGDNGWTHVIGGSYHDKAFNACETADGGYAVTGNYHEGNWNAFIVRYTIDGDTLWTKMWGDPDHSRYNYDIKQLDDGGFITVGSIAGTGNPNVYLSRLSAGTTGRSDFSAGVVPIEVLDVRPNPFNSIASLSCQLNRAGRISISVFDVNGQEMYTVLDKMGLPGTHAVTIGENLPSGIYFCRIYFEGYHMAVKLAKTR